MALSRDTTFWHIFPCFLDASRTPRSPVFDWLMTRASSRLQRASASSQSSSCTPQKTRTAPKTPTPRAHKPKQKTNPKTPKTTSQQNPILRDTKTNPRNTPKTKPRNTRKPHHYIPPKTPRQPFITSHPNHTISRKREDKTAGLSVSQIQT